MDIKQEVFDYNDESYHNVTIKCPPEETNVKYFESFSNTGDFIKQESYEYSDPDVYMDIKQEELEIKDENKNFDIIDEDLYRTCSQNADTKPSIEEDLVTYIPERKCTECDFCTKSKYQLLRHRKKDHPGVLPYKCTECDYTTRKKVSITQHLMSHLGEKPYKCESCDFRTSKQYLLNRHLKFHTEKNLYHCSSCDFKTNQKSTLLQHIRSHTGERPFNCNLCEYTGRTAHQIKVHMMNKHSGNSPYLCNVCGLKIGDKTKLTVHMRTHSGEKPFECDLCGYRLTQKSSLVRHRKIHMMVKKDSSRKSRRPKQTHLENFYWPSEVNPFNMNIDSFSVGTNCFKTEAKPFSMDINSFNTVVNSFNTAVNAFNPMQHIELPFTGNDVRNAFVMNMQFWGNSNYNMNISKFLEDSSVKVKEEAEVI